MSKQVESRYKKSKRCTSLASISKDDKFWYWPNSVYQEPFGKPIEDEVFGIVEGRVIGLIRAHSPEGIYLSLEGALSQRANDISGYVSELASHIEKLRKAARARGTP